MSWLRLSLGLMLTLQVSAQRLNMRSFTVRDGMPQSQPLAIHQDKLGYLWVGTYAGLTRFDGTRWTLFDTPTGIPSTRITCLGEDTQGHVLVGFDQAGLWRYDDSTWSAVPGTQYATPVQIVTQAGLGTWVMTSKRVILIDAFGLQKRPATEFNSSKEGLHTDLAGSPDGRLYCLFSGQLYVCERETWSEVEIEAGSDPRVLAVDAQGDLLVVTSKGILNQATGSWTDFPGGRTFNVSTCAIDATGTVWIGTEGQGILQLKGGQWTPIAQAQGLTNPWVVDILPDREGNVWIATYNDLELYIPGPFVVFDETTGLPHPFVRSTFLDRDHRIWVGTREGVAYFEDGRFHEPDEPRLRAAPIYGIGQDRDGSMLFATAGALKSWNDGTYREIRLDSGDPIINLQTVFVDSRGRRWLGGARLVEWTRDGGFVPKLSQILKSRTCVAFAEDARNHLWIATSLGLIDYDPITESVIDYKQQIPVTVWALDIDPKGRVLAATNGLGMAIVDDGVSLISQEDGLADRFLWQVMWFDDETWVATNHGISRQSANGSWIDYTIDDGLADPEGTATASIVDAQGRLWFGSGNGLSRYDPSMERATRAKPKIVISGVTADGQTCRSNQELQPHVHQLNFHFNAINLRGPAQYQFRLKDIETSWSEPTYARSASYAELGPGPYTFEVRALTKEGLQSAEPARWTFSIKPAWWERLWFRAAALLAILIMPVIYSRLRLASIQHRKQELERQVINRTQSLQRANRELLELQGQLVESAHNAGMAQLARQSLHRVGNALNSVQVAITRLEDINDNASESRFVDTLIQRLEADNDGASGMTIKALQGFLDLRSKHLANAKSELDTLNRGVKEIDRVIRDQQAIASSPILLESANFRQLIEDITTAGLAWLDGFQGKVEIDCSPDFEMKTARLPLKHVLRDLLHQAVEWCEASRRKDMLVRITVDPSPGETQIRIEDNGIGLTERQLQSLFEHSNTKPRPETPVDLHDCANLISELGGKLSLESDGPDQGATSVIRIPGREPQTTT